MKRIFIWCLIFMFTSCKQSSEVHIPAPQKTGYAIHSTSLSKEAYFDKILGALVGSAIGDAMGASTEMWHREAIQDKYGYITGFTPTIREQSPEGPWAHNLEPGATTDDTRWKHLMVKYLSLHKEEISPSHFAKFITNYYTLTAKALGENIVLAQPDSLDARIEKIDWIKEWARVAFAYQENDVAFDRARNRFYGGEMSCAGLLYSPMFGLQAKDAETAYKTAYEHSIFDLGYAKDISSITAAMTYTAMHRKNMDSILQTAVLVDPYNYQDSRLVGRISFSIADAAEKTFFESIRARELIAVDTLGNIDALKIPEGYPHSELDWRQQEFIYSALEKDKKAIAFHAGEIWQILYTALEFGKGDFDKTMQFIVNYGRDNDTVAAIAGMILGAKDGFSNLPPKLREEALRVNKEILGIDLEALAHEMTAARVP